MATQQNMHLRFLRSSEAQMCLCVFIDIFYPEFNFAVVPSFSENVWAGFPFLDKMPVWVCGEAFPPSSGVMRAWQSCSTGFLPPPSSCLSTGFIGGDPTFGEEFLAFVCCVSPLRQLMENLLSVYPTSHLFIYPPKSSQKLPEEQVICLVKVCWVCYEPGTCEAFSISLTQPLSVPHVLNCRIIIPLPQGAFGRAV